MKDSVIEIKQELKAQNRWLIGTLVSIIMIVGSFAWAGYQLIVVQAMKTAGS